MMSPEELPDLTLSGPQGRPLSAAGLLEVRRQDAPRSGEQRLSAPLRSCVMRPDDIRIAPLAIVAGVFEGIVERVCSSVVK